MATGTAPSQSAAALAPPSDQAKYIEAQLKKTEGYVKMVDWLFSLAVLTSGIAVYLLLFALLDHWVFAGGLGFFGRLCAWLLLSVAIGVFGWRQLLPLVLRKVNPIYVAGAIEHAQPSLKNSLVNFLLLRHNPIGIHRLVFQGVEQQAATRLSGVPVESSVDMSRLIKIGYVLIGVVALCVLYKIVSPKDPFVSAYRAIMPWAAVDAPSRVTITQVVPGDAREPLGKQVRIEAEISGLDDDEHATLYYSTADKQVIDKPLRMFVAPGELVHSALLPESTAGLGQDVTYRIEAGDALSQTYRIEAIAAPAIVVKSIEYRYPPYTGLGTRTVERIGHVKAIEGTEIVVRAQANLPIESASIELEGPRGHSVPMSSKETAARGTFALTMKADGTRRIPLLEAYRLRLRTADGSRNQDPIRHDIEIIPDEPPRVEIVQPEKTDLRVPLDGELEFVVRGSDADFALGEMKLLGRKGVDVVFEHDLLGDYQPPYSASYRETYRFLPGKLGLKEGDVVHVQATVKDSKRPQPNLDETVEYLVTIDPPEQLSPQDQQQDGQPQNQQQGQGENQPDQGEAEQRPADPPQQGEQQGQPQQGEGQQQSGEGQQQQGEGQPGQSEPQSGQQGEGQPQSGDQTNQDQQQDGESGMGQPQSGNEGNGQPGQDQQNQDQQAGEGQSGQGDGQQNGEAEPQQGDNAGGQSGTGGNRTGGQSQQQQGEGEPQEGASQDGEAGEPSGANGKPAGGPTGDRGGDRSAQPIDNEGELIEEINRHRQEQEQQGQQDSGQQGEQQNGNFEQGQPNQGQQGVGQAGQDRQQGQPGENQQGDRSQTGAGEGQSGEQGNQNQNQDPSGQGQRGRGEQPGEQPQPGNEGQGERGQQQQGDRQQGDPSAQGQQGENSNPQQGDQPRNGMQNGEQPQQGEPNRQQGERPQGNQQTDGNQQGGHPQGNQDRGNQQQGEQPGNGQESAQPGEQKNQGQPGEQQEQGNGQGQQPKQGRGQDQGDSGQGQKSDSEQGSADPQGKNQDQGQKDGRQQGSEQSSQQNPSSTSTSDKQSNSQGESEGDRSGGGQQGGGQGADQEGKGSAGSNTPDDQGSGAAQESGMGEQGQGPQGQQQADQPSDATSQQPGGQREGEGGQQSNEGERPSPRQGEGQPSNQGNQAGEQGDPQSEGEQQGQSNSEDHQPGGRRSAGEYADTEVDEANVEYARKATDLALQHLENELKQGKTDLLDRTGMTREEAEERIRRWKELKERAGAPSATEQAKRELDERLRSLGLRPGNERVRTGTPTESRVERMRDNSRSEAPSEYSEGFDAFRRGIFKSGIRREE